MDDTISRDQVEKTAHLARILLSEEEIAGFTVQLGSILAYMRKLQELDTGNAAPLAHVLALTNVVRPDEVAPSLPSELAVREAPASSRGFFKVPKVLGEERGA